MLFIEFALYNYYNLQHTYFIVHVFYHFDICGYLNVILDCWFLYICYIWYCVYWCVLCCI